ncbi:CsbD family protein [Sphingomonas sp.]|uniref:CsbD family protein n=1 Tax=Sphingomonas sp. TaxID=28214 RepID=UPI0025ECD471|nr:CsbD family protein [Sphingomonas sp.]MBV9528056.1 CsbD family protein [Sphingomonas sp.]
MNIDTLAGEGTTAKGRIKESFGNATGDIDLQNEGLADQLSGNIRQAVGAIRDFARAQPLLTAVIVAVIGSSLLAGSARRRRAA